MKIADKCLFQIIIFLILMIYCAFCAKSFIFVIISVVLFYNYGISFKNNLR